MLKLPPSHPALLLFDNFKGQCTEKLLKLLDSKIINVVLIPPNCTDRLQPLDLSVNKTAKDFLRKCFQKWYALQVCSQLEGKTSKEPVDLKLSVMKPLGEKWLVELSDYMKALLRMASQKQESSIAQLDSYSEINTQYKH